MKVDGGELRVDGYGKRKTKDLRRVQVAGQAAAGDRQVAHEKCLPNTIGHGLTGDLHGYRSPNVAVLGA